MWRKMMTRLRVPVERAASTNSRSRSANDWPRTRRAMSIHRVIAIANAMLARLRPKSRTSRMTTSKSGMPYQMLIASEIAASIEARQQAHHNPDRRHDQHRPNPHLERDQGPAHDPAEDVAAGGIEAEPVLRADARVGGTDRLLPDRVRRPEDGDDRHQDEDGDDGDAGQRQLIAPDP